MFGKAIGEILNLNFSWDPEKAKSNIFKHKVAFDTASSIFKDPNAISVFDESHSESEERWITIGLSTLGSLVVLVHSYDIIDENNINIRVISARKATKNEKHKYMELQ